MEHIHPERAAPPTQRSAPPPPEPLSPIAPGERIVALDVLRGVAIFGIFIVNIAFFSMPLFEAMDSEALADAPRADQAAWLLVKILFEVKFITLFSLLFGIGMVVQMKRIEARRGDFTNVYIRRLFALAIIGLIHGILIWYGDILFMYAVAGFALLLCRPWSAQTMLIAGTAAFLAGGLFYSGGLAAEVLLAPPGAPQSSATSPERAASADSSTTEHGGERSVDDRWERFREALRESQWNPEHPAWNTAEVIAYKEGPFTAALIMRGVAYAMHIFAAGLLFGFWLRIAGAFLIGSALMKAGFFSAEKRRWHVIACVAGFLFGLPLEVAAALSHTTDGWTPGPLTVLGEAVHYFSSIALTFGYIGAVCLIVSSGALRFLTVPLAAVGRMALTNYLGQSLIATSLMYWWGLGLFGEFTRAQQLALVVAIFLGQILFSMIWLRYFTMGPLEALWRGVTYLKWPSLRH